MRTASMLRIPADQTEPMTFVPVEDSRRWLNQAQQVVEGYVEFLTVSNHFKEVLFHKGFNGEFGLLLNEDGASKRLDVNMRASFFAQLQIRGTVALVYMPDAFTEDENGDVSDELGDLAEFFKNMLMVDIALLRCAGVATPESLSLVDLRDKEF